MARKSVGLPPGLEIRGDTIRIRFIWNGRRHSETLQYPPTKSGIAAASRLRDQIKHLIKHGIFTDARYAELFPDSVGTPEAALPTFGEYAQLWLNSREITEGTRNNYKSVLNGYWMPHLAITHLNAITPTLIRRITSGTDWSSSGVKRNALTKLSTILAAAVADGLIPKNPADSIELPKRTKKEISPFTQEEADRIIARMYATPHWPSQIYAAYFEFLFYTGIRLSEALALKWEAIDFSKRQAHICRTIALGKVQERTKTGKDRFVLLNDRALQALAFAKHYAERRKQGSGRILETPFVFPPSKSAEHIKQTSDIHWQWKPILKELGIRYRPPYNCRHTYATICLMSGMNPAFIAQQLGHSVQMLLSTYARWLNSSSDWDELKKLKIAPSLAQA